MKKLLGAAIVIIALAILGTGIWTQQIEGTSMAAHAPKETPEPQTAAADTHDNSDEIRCIPRQRMSSPKPRASAWKS